MNTMRDTKQRSAIRDAFKNAGNRLLSPKEVTAIASEQKPNLGIATVYRNIKTMLANGEIKAVMLPGQADRYALAEKTINDIYIHKDGSVLTDDPSYWVSDNYTKHTYFIEK